LLSLASFSSEFDGKLTERDVVAILLWLEAKHGASGAIRPDRGPEFIARAVEKWLGARKVRPLYIAPGSLCETWLPNSLYIFEAWLGARLKALVTALRVQGNYTGLDLYNRDQYGTFILAAPNCPCTGECQGAKLLDIEPTLLGSRRL
jgi:hypothetical protein